MSEYTRFLYDKLLVVGVNVLAIVAVSVAMYQASLTPDEFTPTFFKTFFVLLAPVLLCGFAGKRMLRRPSLT